MERRTSINTHALPKKTNNAYAKLHISIQKRLSPATTLKNNSTRRHLSTSGLAQIVAELAQLEPMGKNTVLYLPNQAFTGRSNY